MGTVSVTFLENQTNIPAASLKRCFNQTQPFETLDSWRTALKCRIEWIMSLSLLPRIKAGLVPVVGVFTTLFRQSQGTRSKILNPIACLFGVCVVSLIASIRYSAGFGLQFLLVSFAAASGLLFLGVYVYSLATAQPELLPADTSLIRHLKIQKRFRGDSSSGMVIANATNQIEGSPQNPAAIVGRQQSMKRFVLGTDRTTPEQDRVFVHILKTRFPKVGWWHRLGETWLISDESESLTCEAIRDAATEAFPQISMFVTEAAGKPSWAGFGKNEDFAWLANDWERDRYKGLRRATRSELESG